MCSIRPPPSCPKMAGKSTGLQHDVRVADAGVVHLDEELVGADFVEGDWREGEGGAGGVHDVGFGGDVFGGWGGGRHVGIKLGAGRQLDAVSWMGDGEGKLGRWRVVVVVALSRQGRCDFQAGGCCCCCCLLVLECPELGGGKAQLSLCIKLAKHARRDGGFVCVGSLRTRPRPTKPPLKRCSAVQVDIPCTELTFERQARPATSQQHLQPTRHASPRLARRRRTIGSYRKYSPVRSTDIDSTSMM